MSIQEFLLDKTITNIQIVRGLGIVPTRLEIEIYQNDVFYLIEAEVNFRILYKSTHVASFDDLFLNKKFEEMTISQYRKQKNLENSLLVLRINQYLDKIVGKKIKKVKISKYGDFVIILSNGLKFQLINDTHLHDSSVIRIVFKDEFKETIINNKTFMLPKVIYELKNMDGLIKVIE